MASTKDIGLGAPIWGCPFTLRFPVGTDAGDLETGLAGAADSEVSLDGGAFADCTNEITEIGTTGWYSITLEASEMQASSVAYSMLSGDYGYHATLCPVRCGTVATGTAAAGGAATLTLAAGSTIVDDEYVGYILQLTGGTGSGQAARIIDAVASTRVLTVQADWLTQPDETTTYAVLIPPERAMLLSTVAGDVAGLDGAAMRGTDGAYTGTPPTVEQIQSGLATATALETVDTVVDAIAADVDAIAADVAGLDGAAIPTVGEIQSGLATAAALATVDAVVDGIAADVAAIATDVAGLDGAAMPTVPTVGEIQSGLATAAALATVDAVVDGIAADVDAIATDVAGLDGAAIPTVEQVQTGLATAAGQVTADGKLDAIQAKTDNIPASPAATGDAMTLAPNAITAATIATGAIADAALAADLDSYGARVEIIDDDGAETPADRYCVTWLRNMEMLTTGVTEPKIQVVKLADGTDLVAETDLTAVGSTGAYQYAETTNRIVDGAAYMVLVTATIAASTRTWPHFIGRDSVAA